MTNFEFYKERFKEMMSDGITGVGVDKITDEPFKCEGSETCHKCKFESWEFMCALGYKAWLYGEHEESEEKSDMKTNYQHYAKEICDIWESGLQFGIDKKTNKPVECSQMFNCNNCKFNNSLFNDEPNLLGITYKGPCRDQRAAWLKQPYKETAEELINKVTLANLDACNGMTCSECGYCERIPLMGLSAEDACVSNLPVCRAKMISDNVYASLKNGGYLNE